MHSAERREFFRRAMPAKTPTTKTTLPNCFANCERETFRPKNNLRGFDALSRWRATERSLERSNAWSKENLRIRRTDQVVSVMIRFFNQADSSRRLPKWRPI